MYRLRELWARLFAFRGRHRREGELDREIAAHLEMSIEERISQGMPPAEARRSAVRELGGVLRAKEAFRRQQGLPWIDALARDASYAWRLIRARPSFSAAIVMAVALGVGANTAVFSAAQSVLWRPLPFPEPDRLVRIHQTRGAEMQMPVSPLNYLDCAKLLPSLKAAAAWSGWTYEVTRADGKEAVPGAKVTASLFDVLGIQPVLGRAFVAHEDTSSGPPVAVISNTWWRTRFGARPDVIGSTLTVGSTAYTIVGILPPGVAFPTHEAAIWTPLRIGDSSHRMRRTENYLSVVARLNRGVTSRQSEDDASRLSASLAKEYPASNAGVGFAVRPLLEVTAEPARMPLLLLVGMGVAVLLISCANVAHLLLARALSRQGELALRAALGATKWGLLRQSFTESGLLAGAGGALGILAAWAIVEIVRPILPASIPRRHEIGFDAAVFGYALLSTTVVIAVTGSAPARRACRAGLDERLRGLRPTASRRTSAIGRAAVVVQVALSAVLLIVSLLLVQSLRNVLTVDPGFDPKDLAVTPVTFPGQASDRARVAAHFAGLVQEAERVHGVAAAGLVNHLPLTADSAGTRFTIERRASSPDDVHMAAYRVISPTYFATVGARLVRGRSFTAADVGDAPPVFIVNETMAKRYWPQQDPVGTRIRRGGLDSTMPHTTVVGVVADMKQDALDRQPKPEIFIPHGQFPWPEMALVVRAALPIETVVPDVRAVLSRLSGTPSTHAFQPFEEVLWNTVAARAFTSTLLVLCTLIAGAVAILGVYAVAGHVAAAQTKELAIRTALGASRAKVVDAAVGSTLRPVAAGLVLGMAGAYAVARGMSTALFGISRFDVSSYVAAVLALGIVAALAALLPARRATRIDPIVALRAE